METLQKIFLPAHRGFAYLEILLFALFVIALLWSLLGQKSKISSLLRKSSLFVMIFLHLQFLVGLVMLFWVSPFLDMVKSSGMGTIMKNEVLRFTYIEHPISMLIAVILMTIANKKLKTNEKLSFGVVLLSVIAIALTVFALPWVKLFGA